MNSENEKKFKSSDFYISAYILSLGYKIIHIEKENPRKCFFVFNCAKGQEITEDFLLCRKKIEPKKYVAAIKELKQIIYSNTE